MNDLTTLLIIFFGLDAVVLGGIIWTLYYILLNSGKPPTGKS